MLLKLNQLNNPHNNLKKPGVTLQAFLLFVDEITHPGFEGPAYARDAWCQSQPGQSAARFPISICYQQMEQCSWRLMGQIILQLI